MGPWSVQPGDIASIQNLRSISCVTIRRVPLDPELKLPISRRQLTSSISLNELGSSMNAMTKEKIVIFWTPDYWYCPRPATDAYKELRGHLNKIQEFHTESTASKMIRFFSKQSILSVGVFIIIKSIVIFRYNRVIMMIYFF